jgi:hypothetical protein
MGGTLPQGFHFPYCNSDTDKGALTILAHPEGQAGPYDGGPEKATEWFSLRLIDSEVIVQFNVSSEVDTYIV